MPKHVDAGRLNKRLQVLELREASAGQWAWTPVRQTWGSVQFSGARNLFSAIGVGARSADIVLRRQSLTLHQALRVDGIHLFLTAITERDRNLLDVRAAVCEPSVLTARPQARTGRDALNRPTAVEVPPFAFPGILTERYLRNDADEVRRAELQQRVAVVPKAVVLRAGDLVQRGDEAPYTVRQVLDLDPYKTEYVLERQEDV